MNESKGPSAALEARRKPLQQRSREREEAILLAAQELIESDGFDALTTSHIARKAGVPIGTVYYLYPNKYAIVVRLVQSCMEGIEPIVSAPYGDLRWDDALDSRIDALSDYWLEECGFSQLWKGLRSNPKLADAYAQATQGSVESMLLFVNYATPDLDRDRRFRIAECMVHTIDRLLEESLEQADDGSRLEIVDELKRMLRAYVQSYRD